MKQGARSLLDAMTDSASLTGVDRPKKRRPTMKTTSRLSGGVPESPTQHAMPQPSQQIMPPITPQQQTSGLPPPQLVQLVTPTQSSPPKTTPKTVIKALPTVRDHTTDQLGPGGDEYIPREYDDAGEKKVDINGYLQGGRQYKCKTFHVPNRGDKLFMLATECARVLGYRDSYLLFNKNRSLYKIIASQDEKEHLISQDILPFSYRSRQIAIVTARSMFRQFGSRVIVGGRRVRDDYWETKARKQGFTDQDLAGEKRPGGAKARDAAAAEASANATAMMGHQGDIVYAQAPVHFGHPQPQTVQPGMLPPVGVGNPLPSMSIIAPDQDLRMGGEFRNLSRPRQEISGPAYQDRTQSSPPAELLSQAHHAAEYNKQVTQQRVLRGKYMDDVWRTPHENTLPSLPPTTSLGETLPPVTQPLPSGHQGTNNLQSMHSSQPSSMMSGNSYAQAPHQSPLTQTPMRMAQSSAMRPDQMRSPSISLGSGGMGPSGAQYSYSNQQQMWPQPQTQYSPQAAHPSPHLQQSSYAPPPMRNQQLPSAMQYQTMPQAYTTPSRNMYEPVSQQYFQQNTQSPSTSQAYPSQPQQPGSGAWAVGPWTQG